MKVHRAIAALRYPPSTQRCNPAQSAGSLDQIRRDWLARAQTQSIAADLQLYGAGAALEDCASLAQLVCDHSAARGFADSVLGPLLNAARQRPLDEAPFRYRVSRGVAMIQLVAAGRATLGLAAYEPIGTNTAPITAPATAPATALFSDRDVHECVIGGVARARRHCIAEGSNRALQTRELELREGVCTRLRPLTDARQILEVERSLVLLQLTREPARPRPAIEVDLMSGAVLRTASGDKSASQAVMALAVLGTLKSDSAMDVMEQTALNRDEDAEVRWEAVRQTLGLGAMRGLELLRVLVGRGDDPLSQPAHALRQQVLGAQPGLRVLLKETA